MNSNLNRALSAALMALGGVAPALAQYDEGIRCIDPNNTAPYSINYSAIGLQTELFGAGMGSAGTFATLCENNSTVPIAGRIGFSIGPRGSIQDDLQDFGTDLAGLPLKDDFLRVNRLYSTREDPGAFDRPGRFIPSGGGTSYARVYVTRTTATGAATTNFLYGPSINLFYSPASGRTIISEGSVDSGNVAVRCYIDVLGDAARVNWRLTNNIAPTAGTAISLGLWFGQLVSITDQNGVPLGVPPTGSGSAQFPIPYITIPGRRPLSVHERFPGEITTTVPPYVNFTGGQRFGFGLQVVNNSSALVGFDPTSGADQTAVDEFVLGEAPFLIDGRIATTDPVFGDRILNPAGNGNADAAAITSEPAYIQKWQPASVSDAGSAEDRSRDIVAYYRSTNGDSNYSPAYSGYTVVADSPKAISTTPGNASTFTPNPFTIRVAVDNTGGFSNVDQSVALQNVEATITLPQGMRINGSTARTQTLPVNRVYVPRTGTNPSGEAPSATINPLAIGFVDFQVAVDPDTAGSLDYSVVITPQPGFASKTVRGSINVATAPRLRIDAGANLVSPPWEFADPAWSVVLNETLNGNFQSFTWNARLQEYVTQPLAERGRGTWIVATEELGAFPLGGNPTQPADQFPDPDNFQVGGAPSVRLYRGWNLVGNPYNYSFPLGQLLGIPTGTSNVLTYAQLTPAFTSGAFTFYDKTNNGYRSVSSADQRLQPNRGYWIYANAAFDLQFPPLFDLFIRSGKTETVRQRFDGWRLELTAANAASSDTENYVGIVRTAAEMQANALREAPLAPVKNSVRAYFTEGAQTEMARALRNARGTQTYTYNVFSAGAGPVTIGWPNAKQIPSNLAVTVTDNVTKKAINARTTSGYSFSAAANSTRTFTVKVVPQGTAAQRVGTVSTATVKVGNLKQMKISYFLSGRGGATVRILKGKKVVAIPANDVDAIAGTNSVTWPMLNVNGLPLTNGSYTLEIAATGEGGDTSTIQKAVTISR